MSATANDRDILACTLTEPRVGAWSAELHCDSETALTGAVRIAIDGVVWNGTVTRGDAHAGRAFARVVGGAGKLTTQLDARHYLNPSLYTVLSDIAQNSGETLSPLCDPQLSTRIVPRYVRLASRAGLALKELAAQAGMSWRTLRDGTIWVGTPSWPVVEPEYDETAQKPALGTMGIAPVSPIVEPGCTFAGKKVSRVVTVLSGAQARQEVTFEDGDGSSELSRGAADLAGFVEALVGARFDYNRFYPCRVVGQAGDGSLELLPDNPRIRGNGTSRVPIRHGVPGVRVRVQNGARVMLYFEDGDRTKPAAALWPDGSSVSEMTVTAGKLIVDGDLEVTGTITASEVSVGLELGVVSLSTHTHGVVGANTVEPTPVPPTP